MNKFYDTAEVFYGTSKRLIDLGEENWNAAVIAMFYSAAHYIHAYLLQKAGYLEADLINDFNHSKRTKLCSGISDLSGIEIDYQLLNKRAWNCRYSPDFIRKINQSSEKAKIDKLLESLDSVKTHIESKV